MAYGFIGLESNGAGAWFITDTLQLASAPNGANIQAVVAETLLSGLSGASVTASNFIPANCIVLAVGARVVTTITGATSFEVGVSCTLAQFGSGIGLTAGTLNYGLIGPTAFYSATGVIVTSAGSNFTAGAVASRCTTSSPIRRRPNRPSPLQRRQTKALLMNWVTQRVAAQRLRSLFRRQASLRRITTCRARLSRALYPFLTPTRLWCLGNTISRRRVRWRSPCRRARATRPSAPRRKRRIHDGSRIDADELSGTTACGWLVCFPLRRNGIGKLSRDLRHWHARRRVFPVKAFNRMSATHRLAASALYCQTKAWRANVAL